MKAEDFVRERIEANRNLLVPFFLSLSWLYYEKDESLVPDALYDEMGERLLAEWDKIEHWHKHLIDREALKAGTGFYLKYPERVERAAWALYLTFNPPKKRRRRRR